MTGILRAATTTVLLFTGLLGLAAPAAMTGIAGAVFPGQAGGSLIERDGQVVGSALIGQAFAEPRYFHPRPSAAGSGYDASAAAASQQGPTSAKLAEAVRERVAAAGPKPVPADAVTASGSGLDPHISPENAARQVPRIAAARGLPEARVLTLLRQHTEGRELGLLGEPRVNVLQLNLALDTLR
ncbi:potassium-transporting ATPase subunit KdpC [Pseudoroseomonas ludipueritiae]|uniref:Potassium-transporting ATPase KdpC subunit n=1 Tax=Pseudoroseomonas ludipueritiae TaxID=198093 RepID=A0ABR7R4G4_9PROT|nr:potassium-transporting ATPase subunit KdpC [Pseudoroseomonas ludipueritiae]MBC9176616.1 potassium-transporting ATPase subunit KdpC [Pseudoroseomonas ludipueritiae]